MTIVKITAIAMFAFVLSACGLDPRNYETAPVQVETSKGTVTCQLYTPDTIVWDQAITVPAGMSIQEGDAVCKAEGAKGQ